MKPENETWPNMGISGFIRLLYIVYCNNYNQIKNNNRQVFPPLNPCWLFNTHTYIYKDSVPKGEHENQTDGLKTQVQNSLNKNAFYE